MKRRAIFSWLMLIIAAGVCSFCFRYYFGAFQGYLVISINGTKYGFAHLKDITEWVSGNALAPLPAASLAVLLASVVVLFFAVRFTYQASKMRRTQTRG